MKKNILMALVALIVSNLNAQLKIGANPKSINNNTNFHVGSSDGNNFVISRDSTKVGVGTLTPSNLLHVKSDGNPIRLEGLLKGDSAESILTVNDSGVVRKVNGQTLSATYEPWYNVSTNLGATSNTQNIYQMGRVGVMTNSPTFPLEVMGTNVLDGFAIGNSSLGSSFRSKISTQGSGTNDRWMKFNSDWNSTTNGTRAFGFFRGTNEYMTILDNGNVGIGINYPTWLLDVRKNTANSELIAHFVNTGGQTTTEAQVAIGGGPGQWMKIVGYNGTLGFRGYNTNTEIMTMKSVTGFIGIGTTNPLYPVHIKTAVNTNLFLENTSGDPDGVLAISIPNSNINCGGSITCSNMISFQSGGTWIGTIVPTSNGLGTQYLTTSDLRLKENILPTSFSIDELMKLNVVDYNYKSDSKKNKEVGFIAQEVHKVLPAIVRIGEEELGKEGLPKKPWMVDYSRLTPHIIKATQDLKKDLDQKEIEIRDFQQKLEDKNIEIAQLKSMILQLKEEFQNLKSLIK